MLSKTLAKSVYGLFAALYLVAGVSVLLLGTGLLPLSMSDVFVNLAQGNSHTLHIM